MGITYVPTPLAADKPVFFAGGPPYVFNRSFQRTASLGDDATFSRASTGAVVDSDGVLRFLSINAPRFYGARYDGDTAYAADESGNHLPGIALIKEPTATNIWPWSHDITQCSKNPNPNDVVFYANQTAAPDGTITADAVSKSTNTGSAIYFKSFSGSTNTFYCFSVYAKQGTNRWVALGLANSGFGGGIHQVKFDLQNGEFYFSEGSLGDYGFQALGGGWYRIWVVKRSDADGGVYIARLQNFYGENGLTETSTGDGSSREVYVWGAQVEVGQEPTSLIATSGSSASRSADVLSYSGVLANNETRVYVNDSASDTDDWDGTVDETGSIKGITVYEPGYRP